MEVFFMGISVLLLLLLIVEAVEWRRRAERTQRITDLELSGAPSRDSHSSDRSREESYLKVLREQIERNVKLAPL